MRDSGLAVQNIENPQYRRRRGFTLIELLVVISVIAMLAAILFPVFARAREKARQTSCASNLKQLALGFAQYKQDYDGRFPHAWDTDLSVAGTASYASGLSLAETYDEPVVWPAKLQPYLKSRQVFSCPSVNKVRSSACASIHPSYNWRHEWAAGDPVVGAKTVYFYRGASQVAYGYNTAYLGGGQFAGLPSCANAKAPSTTECYTCGIAAHASSIAKPAETVLLIDTTWGVNGYGTPPAFADVLSPADAVGDFWCKADGSADSYDNFDPRHNEGLNVAFADGHVKWMKKEKAIYRPFGTNKCYQINDYGNDDKFLWDRS